MRQACLAEAINKVGGFPATSLVSAAFALAKVLRGVLVDDRNLLLVRCPGAEAEAIAWLLFDLPFVLPSDFDFEPDLAWWCALAVLLQTG